MFDRLDILGHRLVILGHRLDILGHRLANHYPGWLILKHRLPDIGSHVGYLLGHRLTDTGSHVGNLLGHRLTDTGSHVGLYWVTGWLINGSSVG